MNNFITHIAISVAIIAAGGLVSSLAAFDPGLVASVAAFDPNAPLAMRLAFGVAAFVAQVELFAAAWYLRSRKTARFDMIIAAETLVALGVFSLIVGIVLAALAMPNLSIAAGSATLADFNPLLISFGEGLFASATAPLLATILRQIEALNYGPSAPPRDPLALMKDDIGSLARAITELRTELETATKDTVSFAKAARSILGGLNELAASIKDVKGAVPTALTAVSREIGAAGPGIVSAFSGTADNIRSGGGLVSAAFNATTGNIRTGSGQVSKALESAASDIRSGSGHVTTAFEATTGQIRSGTGQVSKAFESVAVDIRSGSGHVTTAFEATAGQIRSGTGQISKALESVAVDIRSGSGHVTTAFEATAGQVRTGAGQLSKALETAAHDIGAKASGISTELASAGASLNSFRSGMAAGADSMKKMGDALDKMGTEVRAATGVLRRLQELIDTVTSFIRPDRT